MTLDIPIRNDLAAAKICVSGSIFIAKITKIILPTMAYCFRTNATAMPALSHVSLCFFTALSGNQKL